MLIRLVCPGQPVSAKNSQRAIRTTSGKARIIKSAAIAAWYARVVPALEAQWRQYQRPTLKGPLHITMHQFLEQDPLSKSSPDGDNVQSGVWDALQQAGVLANDNQIIAWAGTRQQGDPHVLVEIRELP